MMILCPRCTSPNFQRRGSRKGKQRARCSDCGKWFFLGREKEPGAKVLVLDIETSLMKLWAFSLSPSKSRIPISHIETDWFMLTWAAKWLDNDKIISASVTPREAREQNDERIVRKLWKLLETADAVVTHNGDRFDFPALESRYELYHIGPNLPYYSIDTYRISKRLRTTSRKLDYLMGRHSRNTKFHTDFDLWVRCTMGDKEALHEMRKYNEQDILVGEAVYKYLRVWDKRPLNMGLFQLSPESPVCPVCGSDNITFPGSLKFTAVNSREAFRCLDCQYVGVRRTSALNKKQRKHVLK